MLGPLLYLLYTSPIADIINLHSLQYHLYADDSQLYISFKSDCFADLAQAKSSVELCVKDIDWWMTNNMLKLNQEKTPGGDSHMKQTGMLVGNFEFNP